MYDYCQYLETVLADSEGERKVVRTEQKLVLATARLLNETTYHSLSVSRISEGAGLAHGTFYRYFKTRSEIVAKMLEGYFDFVRKGARQQRRGHSTRERIFISNLHYIRCFRQNVGLMRCLFQLKDEDQLIGKVANDANDELISRVIKRNPLLSEDSKELQLSLYALAGMVDELLLKVYGRTNPPLVAYSDSPEIIAEVISKFWYDVMEPAASNTTSPEDQALGVSQSK
ncbi:Bacterial regulatory protein, tetR family protein [Sulfitobacter noctilucae]|uniref:TetR/AcrR family transcriptional regulator n=1 Tax=Sulfitobacter noctilucae TaxID=1342302 RepID=UPI00046816D1|nr:TetR/AcrR family transcriptional regulator [Sulfitobacter noctilucae]KIN69819.1 Bacterial regulatory protein, tetR family protein [Sulfitobacter noctilucae]